MISNKSLILSLTVKKTLSDQSRQLQMTNKININSIKIHYYYYRYLYLSCGIIDGCRLTKSQEAQPILSVAS